MRRAFFAKFTLIFFRPTYKKGLYKAFFLYTIKVYLIFRKIEMKNLKTKTCNFGEQNFSIAYVDILDGTKLCFIFDKSYYLINPQSNGGDLEIYKMLSTNGEFQKVEEVEIYHKCGEIYESFLHDLKKMDEEIEDFYNNEKYIYLAKLACHFDLG